MSDKAGPAKLALLSLVGLTCITAPAHAAFPGKNGRIAYSIGESPCNSDSGNGFVETVNPDGTGVQTLGEGCNPAWSADGTRLAFDVALPDEFEDGANFLFTSAADGSDRANLGFIGFNEGAPSWSPDGQSIVYSCSGICIRNVSGGGRRLLSERCNVSPAWSPDGTRIAFTRIGFSADNCSGPKGLLTMSAAGGDERLVAASEFAFGPNWSPDGQSIVYGASERVTPNAFGFADLFVVAADGSGRTRLTQTSDASEGGPAWSPDGTRIVFTSFGSGGFVTDVHVMRSDGTDPRVLVAGAGGPDWQPVLGPKRADFKNGAHFCKAEREFWGAGAFRERYGGHANAFGKCVSTQS